MEKRQVAIFGFHASHEQFSPGELLRFVRAAEEAGFDAAMSSDHFAPWSERQGQSGFAYAWIGAALAATSRLRFGMITVPGGWRYHPTIVAQAGATLREIFGERFAWFGFGSGEAMNEAVVGAGWPEKATRNARLRAGVEIARALWAGETVTRKAPIPVCEAKLWTLPSSPPLAAVAALTPETAEWAGGWADAMVTVNQPREKLQALIDAFRRGGGEGKPLLLQVHVSWAATEAEARANAWDQWRSNLLTPDQVETLRTPAEFAEATAGARPEDLDAAVRISSDAGRHVAWLEEDLAMGFSEVYFHNVGRNQAGFIEAFGANVLPRTR
jgi:probable non-F420 flavinoid oxidoreductase